MICPHCDNEVVCGCENCKDENEAKGFAPLIQNEDSPPSQTCPHCGHTMENEEWVMESVAQQFEESEEEGSPKWLN